MWPMAQKTVGRSSQTSDSGGDDSAFRKAANNAGGGGLGPKRESLLYTVLEACWSKLPRQKKKKTVGNSQSRGSAQRGRDGAGLAKETTT